MDDAACLAIIQRGGQEAQQGVATLYQRYAGPLREHLQWRFRLSCEEVEDMVHDAFMNFIRDIHTKTARGEALAVASVRAWLWTIAVHRATDLVRSAAYRFQTGEAADATQGDAPEVYTTTAAPDEVSENGVVDCVRRAWEAFTRQEPERAEALRLAIVEGWSMKELAMHLKRSDGAMREYLSQCRKKLRPYLEHWCGENSQPSPSR